MCFFSYFFFILNHFFFFFFFALLLKKVVIPQNLGFILFCILLSFLSTFGLLSFYRCLVCCRFIDVVLFVILLRHFIYVGVIQTSKIYLINRIYQIMIISILNN